MKQLIACFCLVLVVGCASFNATVFNTEKVAVDSVYASVRAFNQYYRIATNGMSSSDLDALNERRDMIYVNSRKFSKTVATTEALRIQYNNDTKNITNRTAVEIALHAVTGQSSNIVALVKMFITE